MNRQSLRNLVFALLTAAGVSVTGIVVYNDAPAIHAGALSLRVPCIGATCFMVMVPTVAECTRLLRGGGEPIGPDPATQTEPYGGAAGKLGRVLRDGVTQNVWTTYHTEPLDPIAGTCRTTVFMTPDQRRALRQTVDVGGAGSEVVDGRRASLVGGRTVVPAGVDPLGAEVEESDDAGPGVDGGF